MNSGYDIAVIGMAGRFPGAPNLAAFWRNLCDGVESVRFFSDDELRQAGIPEEHLRDSPYVKAGSPIADADKFDARFFGFNPKDAAIMDPQHRLFLECAWSAMEDAGHYDGSCKGAVGV